MAAKSPCPAELRKRGADGRTGPPGLPDRVVAINTTSLHSSVGNVPPEEYEAFHHARHQPGETVGVNP